MEKPRAEIQVETDQGTKGADYKKRRSNNYPFPEFAAKGRIRHISKYTPKQRIAQPTQRGSDIETTASMRLQLIVAKKRIAGNRHRRRNQQQARRPKQNLLSQNTAGQPGCDANDQNRPHNGDNRHRGDSGLDTCDRF